MLTVIPFYSGDVAQARELLKWIKDLGGCPEHSLLLVADAAIQWSIGLEMIALGNKAFRHTGLITTKESVAGWPQGSNMLWRTTAAHCKAHRTSFLWLEPDAIPLKPGWLDQIQKAYDASKKQFLGRVYAALHEGVPPKSMSGIAVYPENVIDLVESKINWNNPWDMEISDIVVPLAESTKLIQHFWGPAQNQAPTFASVRTKDSPVNTFTLDNIDAQAVVFHRNKNGTLINLLRNKLNIAAPEIAVSSRQFDVVFPFCATDADLALKNMQWMAELNSYPYTMILAIDDQSRLVNEILRAAQAAFEQVILFKYPLPPVPGHPQAANWAFRHTARYMEQRGKPWLWMEPDMIPLKPEWLDVLQGEYEACGMDCMGSIVPDLGWINGTSVYPPNLASTCPNLMSTPDGHWAFDTVIHPEIVHRTHNAAHLLAHVWCQVNDTLLPYGSGQLPSFHNKRMLAQIPHAAMTLHRVKDDSLIRLLREQKGIK